MGQIIYLNEIRKQTKYDHFFRALNDGISHIGHDVFTVYSCDIDIGLNGYFHLDLVHNPSGCHVLFHSTGENYFAVKVISPKNGVRKLPLTTLNREIKSENAVKAVGLIKKYLQEEQM